MKKFVKISAIVGAIIVVVFVAAAGVLYAVVDTQRIKSTLADVVRENTGRELAFKGDVKLSVFPWLGVELGPVSLSNAQGFGDAPFASVRSTSVRVKLMPLLSRDVQVGGVTIDGLSLNLARDANGRTNWDDLAKAAEGEAAAPSPGKDGAGEAQGLALAGLAVDGVHLTDAGITWSDAATGQRLTLSGANLDTGPLALGKPFDFSFVTTAQAAEPAVTGALEVKARADLGKDFKEPRLTGLDAKVSADGGVVPGGHVDVSLGGDIVVNLNTSTITVSKLILKALDLDVSGDVTVARFDTAPVVNAELSFARFNPRELMDALGLPQIETTDPTALEALSGSIAATATADSATVRKLALTLDDTRLSGTASVKHFAKPAIAFDLEADTVDVNRYLPPAEAPGEKGDAPDTQKAGKGKAAKGEASSGLPKEALRALDVDGKLRVGSLTVHKVRVKDLDVTVKAKDGLIRITPLTAGLYGGLFKTALTADMRSDVTRSALDLDFSGLQLGSVLKDFIGEDKVTGVAQAGIKLAGVGEDWPSLARTLSGSGAVALRNGLFKGFQVVPAKVRKQASQSKPGMKTVSTEKQQPFKDISASFTVKNGIVSTSDASLKADGLGGTGTGTVNLAARTVDYRAVVDMTALPDIPFTIKGDWADPDISLDTAAFLQGTVKSIITAPLKIGKGAGEVGGKIIEGIGDGIMDIFGGSKRKNGNQ